jgi:hypothetical protein
MKKELKVTIDEQDFIADSRIFKTGNTGYGLYGKITLEGKTYQLSMNIVLLGGKGVKA